jgi:hypothetical protein
LLRFWTTFFLSFSSAVVIADERDCVLMRPKEKKKYEQMKKKKRKKSYKYEHGRSWRHKSHRKKRFNIIGNITDTIS